jgi:TonB-dependent SusC/RagA subfamily outer membrane receptor
MNLNKPLPTWFLLLLLALIALSAGSSDEDTRYQRIRNALNKFTYEYPQAKVFLHLDKTIYQGGDNLWIKAYLVSGLSHFPDTFSTNLYVELISPFQTRVEIKRLQLFDGFGIGDFTLSDTLPEGLYQIRAYTSWMQNFAPDFYFKQNFQLINPGYTRFISPKQARVNKRELEDRQIIADDIDLQFMPEGGYLVEGIESLVAFKAINKLGKGVDVQGIIADDNRNEVTVLKSFYKGIGTFKFKPEKGVKYYAITREDDKEKRTLLPQALETGLVMHTDVNSHTLSVEFITNRPQTKDPTANELIIVGQVGGKIYYHSIVRLENRKATLEIPKNYFPGGVMQLTAFSGRGEPLSERLVFISNDDFMKISFLASDTIAENGHKIILEMRASDEENLPLRANFSLAITRELSGQSHANRDNILSNLYLTSDLKGFVEDPLDYFNPQSQEALQAIDNLMLTQGWRRFEWDKILAGAYPKIMYYEERGLAVFGKITHDFFNIPLKNCRVQLSIMDEYNDVFTQQTSKKGMFLFENMVYYDTVKAKIEAWRPSGRRNLIIVLPEEYKTQVIGQQGNYSLTTLSERDNKAYRKERAVEFHEALVKEQERLKEAHNNEVTGIYGEADYVLRSEDFIHGQSNVLEAMKGRIPGVQINGNRVEIRGPNSILGSTQPLFLLDGMPVNDVGAIQAIPVQDIDRIEILKGPSAAIYGLRGANGVVAVYTKRGQFSIRGVLEFEMLGYHLPRVFYEPKYKPEQEPANSYTLLWKPVIITNTSGKARVMFDKPMIEGNYRFDLQGISYSGHAGFVDTIIYNP